MLTVAIAGCVVVLACWGVCARSSRQMRNDFQRELDKLSETVRALEQNVTEHAAAAAASTGADNDKVEIIPTKPTESLAAMHPCADDSAEIPPKIQDAIKATLSAFLGRKVRIRSAKLLENPDAATAWATQGRIALQSSHNQRNRD